MNEPGAQSQQNETGTAALHPRTVVLLCVVFALSAACASIGSALLAVLLLLIASASGALLCFAGPPALLLLPAVCAYPLAWLLSGSPLMALVPLPVAALLGFSARRKKTCSAAVVRVTVFLTVCGGGAMLAWLFVYEGEVSGGAVSRFAGQAYDLLFRYMKTAFADSAGLLTDEAMSDMARYLVATSPAFLITAAGLFAFFSAKFFGRLCRAFGVESGLSDPHWIFDMSLISASVFVIVTVMALVLASTEAEPVYYTAANLQIILTPGLALIGLRSAFAGMVQRMSRGTTAIAWILILGLCLFLFQILVSMFALVATLFSVVGAISVIRRALPRRKSEDGE